MLFLPDEILVADHYSAQAWIERYDFAAAGFDTAFVTVSTAIADTSRFILTSVSSATTPACDSTITGQSGANGALETDDLINMIFAKDEVSKYICRCIYRWFVYYTIDAANELLTSAKLIHHVWVKNVSATHFDELLGFLNSSYRMTPALTRWLLALACGAPP